MTTDQSPEPIVAAALRHAASLVEGRHYVRFLGGPELWTVIHMAAVDIIAGPSAEHLRKYLAARQLQHWEGNQRQAVAVLRAAASEAPPLADAQADAALADMELGRAALRQALNYCGYGNDEPMSVLADQMGHQTRLKQSMIGELETEVAQLRAQIRDLEAENAALHRKQAPAFEVFGPFDSEDDARALPAVRAAYDSARVSPRRGVLTDRNHRMLCRACSDAGITVGAFDHLILMWLANYEPQTVAVIAGLIRRAAGARKEQL